MMMRSSGNFNRLNRADSFVITEDHYVDCIAHADIDRLFPVMLAQKIRRSHFLFLGYSLRDWNVRVMLYRLRREGTWCQSRAIEAEPAPVDLVAWDERGVNILHVRAEHFLAAIQQRLFPLEAA